MSTEKEVTAFLKDFKTKMEIWDILFRDERGKNAQTLAALEIRPIERKTILENLTAKDYSQGPIEKNYMEVRICGCLVKPSKSKKYVLKLLWEPWELQ